MSDKDWIDHAALLRAINEHDEFFLNGIRYYTQEQLDAAVAEAYQRGLQASQKHYTEGYRWGRAHALRDAVEAVKALPVNVPKAHALAAIESLGRDD